MKVNAPCKGCEKRVIGCHKDCEAYKEWFEKQRQEKIDEQKHSASISYDRDRAYKLRDYKNKRK